MNIEIIAFVLLSYLFASFLKGITGLGFSTICLPILTSLIEPKVSIPLVILPSLTSNVLVMVQAKRLREAFSRFWLVYISAVPGLILGVYILQSADSSISRAILGIVLAVYGAWALRSRTNALSRKSEVWLSSPVGLCTGVVIGMTGSQVMPVLPFMLSLKLNRETFVQAINISFTFSSIIMLILLNRFGLLKLETLGVSFVGIVPVAIGIFLGGRLRRSLKEETYRKAVLIFLLVIGVSLIARI